MGDITISITNCDGTIIDDMHDLHGNQDKKTDKLLMQHIENSINEFFAKKDKIAEDIDDFYTIAPKHRTKEKGKIK